MPLQRGAINHMCSTQSLTPSTQHLIEIERLVKEGEQLVRQMQNQGVQMQAEQLPTSAIVRNPLLAIRWRLPNQKVSQEAVLGRTF
jgi:hypothetical protein